VAASLIDNPGVRVEIGGHTDSTGDDAYNLQLSTRRAESVRDELIGLGVDAEQLIARGYGETLPIADNDAPAGRVANRRVELKRL
jgi:OOP family OmpA-OmpF porin